MLHLLILFVTVFATPPTFAGVYTPRPSDWVSHKVSNIEIIEIAPPAEFHPTGALLMIPGFFQNGASFDLLPEKNISVARFLMRRFGLKIYLLNTRGLGFAAKGSHLSLDDIAMDDIPQAIHWISQREKSKIYVLGHSQGGITLQAALGGLTRCTPSTHCFSKETAIARQSEVKAIALSGANVDMTSADPKSSLQTLGKIGFPIRKAFTSLMDRILVRDLSTNKLFAPFAYLKPWEFLYHRENVSSESKLALFQRTIEGSTAAILVQYIEGIHRKGIRSNGASGELYSSGLKNIFVPSAHVTYGLDTMAEPGTTFRDDFSKLGSPKKKYFIYEGQGHEDWLMVESLHRDWEAPIEWLLAQ